MEGSHDFIVFFILLNLHNYEKISNYDGFKRTSVCEGIISEAKLISMRETRCVKNFF